MGLMDKMKQQAEQAFAKAQQGVSQGQAKLDQVQAKRQADALVRDLGAAYYALQRTGGPQEAVDSAMKLLDDHVAAHGPLDAGIRVDGEDGDHAAPGERPSSQEAPSAPSAGATTTAGDFSIDDV